MNKVLWSTLVVIATIPMTSHAQTVYSSPSGSRFFERGDTIVWVRVLAASDSLRRKSDTIQIHFVGDSAFVIRDGKAARPLSPFYARQFRFMLDNAKWWTEFKRKVGLRDTR